MHESSPLFAIGAAAQCVVYPLQTLSNPTPTIGVALTGLHRITLVIIGNVIFENLPQNPLLYFEKCLVSIEIYHTIIFQP